MAIVSAKEDWGVGAFFKTFIMLKDKKFFD